MAAPLFLIHVDAAGAKTHIALDAHPTSSVFYLPDVDTEELTVTTESDDAHSCIRLDAEEEYCLLTVYSMEAGPTYILGDTEIQMPLSTDTHQKSLILTEEHQLVTPTGRWLIEWDRTGHISNSMRPPALPNHDAIDNEGHLEPVELDYLIDGEILLDREEMTDSEEEMHEAIPVTEIRLSPPHSEDSDHRKAHIVEAQNDLIARKSLDISDIGNEDVTDAELAHSREQISKELEPPTIPSDDPETGVAALEDISSPHAHHSCEQEAGTSTFTASVLTSRNDSRSSTCQTGKVEPTQPAISDSSPRTDAPTNETADAADDIAQQPICVEDRPEINFADSITIHTEAMDETASEDDSQQQADTRIPKRHLIEIENGRWAEHKRQKTSALNELASISNQDSDTDPGPTLAKSSHVEQDGSQPAQKPKSRVSFSIAKPTPVRSSLRRKSETPDSSQSAYTINFGYRRPAVIFGSTSEVSHDKKVASIIQRLGGTIVTDINRANILCVGAGPLKKTCKFIMGVAMGKDIVTDDWVRQCYIDQKFADLTAFLPNDSEHERAWKFKLVKAIERGKQNLKLLHGFHVHLTTQLRKDLGNLTKEIKQIAITLGASVRAGLPKENSKHQVLVVSSSKNVDPEVTKIDGLGYKVYSQDILTMAALRGKLEMNSTEFVIDVPIKEEEQTSSQ